MKHNTDTQRLYGRCFEDDFFGKEIIEVEERMLLYEVQRVKQFQKIYKWNPALPRTDSAAKLFYAVRAELPKKARKQLRLYAAIGTHLDRFYGIDAFFTLGQKLVTLDLSISVRKSKSRLRADVLVSRHMIENGHELEILARDIVVNFWAPYAVRSNVEKNLRLLGLETSRNKLLTEEEQKLPAKALRKLLKLDE